jgi:GTPase
VHACRIAELAAAEGRAVVLVLNKWDLVEERTEDKMKAVAADVKAQLRSVSWAQTVFTSASLGTPFAHKTATLCAAPRPACAP